MASWMFKITESGFEKCIRNTILSKERIWYPPEDGLITYTETCRSIKITFLCILYLNNLYVLCAFIGNICRQLFYPKLR